MTSRNWLSSLAVPALAAFMLIGCKGESAPKPEVLDKVFDDEFASGVTFEMFGDGAVADLGKDTTVAHAGSASLRIGVPTTGWTGGVLKSTSPRDLRTFNALTFWAKASAPATVDVVGFGNDNTGNVAHDVHLGELAVGTDWQKVVLPLPDPSVLASEAGLFYFAEAETGGYTLWLDDMKFEALDASVLGAPVPSIKEETVAREVGTTAQVSEITVTFPVNNVPVTESMSARYLTFSSSAADVATVDADGLATAQAVGTAVITARLGTVDAQGALTVNVSEANMPASAAPVPPARPAAEVVSLFSDAYAAVPVTTWSAEWDSADVADLALFSDPVKKYSNLLYAGIELPPVDASATTRFHADVWTHDSTLIKVKLVDFGADGAYGGGDDAEHELIFDGSSSPALAQDTWVSIDVPLSRFAGLTHRAHLAQVILSGSNSTVYLDNLYLYVGDAEPLPTPSTPAPTPPARDAADVKALLSGAYAELPVTTWSADWDSAAVEDLQIAGDAAKKYTGLQFAGVEFPAVDATAMTRFHLDAWTPDATHVDVKLVDFGADGAYGGGDDTEGSVVTDGIATGQWVSVDVPLTAFSGLAARAHLAQLVLSSSSSTVYVDNVYLYTTGEEPPVGGGTVFDDALATDLAYSPFGGSAGAPSSDANVNHAGTASMFVPVPGPGAYIGGAFLASAPRDLSGFNALTFWAKATDPNLLDSVGLGDRNGASPYAVSWHQAALTTEWQKFTIPLPDPSKLTAEPGVFFVADAAQDLGRGMVIWLDDVQYEVADLSAYGAPAAAIATESKTITVGSTGTVAGQSLDYAVAGGHQVLSVGPGWFTYESSNPAAATVDADGVITPVAPGTTNITARFKGVAANGLTSVTVVGLSLPTAAAPAPPARTATDVISLYSGAYDNVPVDSWLAAWSQASVTDVTIAGDAAKKYSGFGYAGVEFVSHPVDATAMTHVHMDIWTGDATSFLLKVVDFGANAEFGGGDDSEGQLNLTAVTSPALVTGQWVSIDVPFSAFQGGPTARAHLEQLVLQGSPGSSVWVDNIYFYK
ncbi:MAG: Ig-like domain-containing protein [Anaeromyxobacter sp.]